ncbi:MAG: glycosyltransferase [Actinomycetota bacterium]
MTSLDIGIVQYALPWYREALFASIASDPRVSDLTLYLPHPEAPGTPVDGVSIVSRPWHRHDLPAGRGPLTYLALPKSTRHDVLVFPWDLRRLEVWSAGIRRLKRRRGRSSQQHVLWGHGPSTWHEGLGLTGFRLMERLFDLGLCYSGRDSTSIARLEVGNSLVWEPERPGEVSEWAWPDDADIRALFVSRLQDRRKLWLAFDAISRLNGDGHKASMVVVGDGELDDRSAAAARRAGGRVHLLGAEHRQSVLRAMHRTATCGLYPAAAGLAAVLAAQNGLPVVVADDTRHGPEIALLQEAGGVVVEAPGDSLSVALLRASGLQVDDDVTTQVRERFEPANHARRIVDRLVEPKEVCR